MPTPKKIRIVEELTDQIARSTIVIGAEYQGLRVAEMGALRRQLRSKGLHVRVAKNTLLRLAADAAGKPEVGDLGQGPTAVLFGFADVVETAKVIRDYTASAKNAFAPRSAYLSGRLLSALDLTDLALLPPKPVLIGRLSGSLQGPVFRLAQLLSSALAPATNRLLDSSLLQLHGLLEARAQQIQA